MKKKKDIPETCRKQQHYDAMQELVAQNARKQFERPVYSYSRVEKKTSGTILNYPANSNKKIDIT